MYRLSVLIVVATALFGCATDSSYQRTTAGFTGCSEDDIQISDVNTSGANSWKAICKDNALIYKCDQKGCAEIN